MSAGRYERLIFDAEYATGAQQKEAHRELAEQPDILPASLFYWRGFQELGSDRAIGMDIGPIPFRAIVSYCDEYGLVDHEREAFARVIRALDNRHQIIRAEKQKKAEKKQTTSGSSNGIVVDEW